MNKIRQKVRNSSYKRIKKDTEKETFDAIKCLGTPTTIPNISKFLLKSVEATRKRVNRLVELGIVYKVDINGNRRNFLIYIK